MRIEEAAVVFTLRIRLKEDKLEDFKAYVEEAFPVFEKDGDCLGMVYSLENSAFLDEVFFYASEEAFRKANWSVEHDPVQVRLLKSWHALLAAPPEVSIARPFPRSHLEKRDELSL